LEEQPRVFIGDEQIKGVQVTKALGIKIDQFLTWDSHIEQILKKIFWNKCHENDKGFH
jgi:hypothetical protein